MVRRVHKNLLVYLEIACRDLVAFVRYEFGTIGAHFKYCCKLV